MPDIIIFDTAFPMSTIMCFPDCGKTIKNAVSLNGFEFQPNEMLPNDAEVRISANVLVLGLNHLRIFIKSKTKVQLSQDLKDRLTTHFHKQLTDVGHPPSDVPTATNRLNVGVNLLTVLVIIGLHGLFPPSISLTITLTTLSFISSTFTSRSYLWDFINHLRHKRMTVMSTSISLSWFLSSLHTLFHAISMPLMGSFSMIFMTYLMPVLLIGIINAMDELKRLILKKSQEGMRSLFPKMSDTYMVYEDASFTKFQSISKDLLKAGMWIQVNPQECFPVDGHIISGETVIDNSQENGELNEPKYLGDKVSAGAINQGEAVVFYTETDNYDNSLNQLLFWSNRNIEKSAPKNTFYRLYMGLSLICLTAAVAAPLTMGILTFSIFLKNVIGILCTFCPCGLIFFEELPLLFSIYARNRKGIRLCNEEAARYLGDIHTYVFDKTGTLTTGQGQAWRDDKIIDKALLRKVYLLEKYRGRAHPIAKAIIRLAEQEGMSGSPLNKTIESYEYDEAHCGLWGEVDEQVIHIGNSDYMQRSEVTGIFPPSEETQAKLDQGYSIIYVAENKIFKGYILIKHEIRPEIFKTFQRLKASGKACFMFTGNKKTAAEKFNQQNQGLFEPDHIKADLKPLQKETELQTLIEVLKQQGNEPKDLCYVGEGHNDAGIMRISGISVAINSTVPAAFYADICLNQEHSLDYLRLHHKPLNLSLKKITSQNQYLMIFSSLCFLSFIVASSLAKMAVLPLIPLGIMVFTIGLSLLNAYRVKLDVDIALDKQSSWAKRRLASDFSFYLVMTASSLGLASSVLSLMSGGTILPSLTFTGGLLASISSVCTLAAGGLFGLFIALTVTYLVREYHPPNLDEGLPPAVTPKGILPEAKRLSSPSPKQLSQECLEKKEASFQECTSSNDQMQP